jgi:hypothetical protein
MDDLLQESHALEGMLLTSFQKDELGDNSHISYTFFEIMKYASTTPLFGNGVKVYQTRDNN